MRRRNAQINSIRGDSFYRGVLRHERSSETDAAPLRDTLRKSGNSFQKQKVLYSGCVGHPVALGMGVETLMRVISVVQISMSVLVLMPCPCASLLGSGVLIILLSATISCAESEAMRMAYLPLFGVLFAVLSLKIISDLKRLWDRRCCTKQKIN